MNELLSVISMTHLSDLQSPTLIEHHPDYGIIRLLGPNRSFSFDTSGLWAPFTVLPPPYLADVRVFRLIRQVKRPRINKMIFSSSSLPALETFVVEHEVTLSHLFELFSDSPPPSSKTLAFLDCRLDEGFMDELARFAYNRKNATLARLNRVVIIDSSGILPGFTSLDKLGKHVPTVDAQIGKRLPEDLM